jgi:N-acetyl-gamma-glutamyl-phosphate reductase
MAISPLLKQGLILPETTIIDAKSGTSGGEDKLRLICYWQKQIVRYVAYNVAGKHRHTPEIEQICSDLAGHEVRVQFTPHLMPMVRGILSTVYATLRDSQSGAG